MAKYLKFVKKSAILIMNSCVLSQKIEGEKIRFMKITVCIGSSCHIKGSRQVVETLNRLIKENSLQDKIELGGTFCLGQCQQSVCVSIENEIFSVSPETAEAFFQNEVLKRV